VRLLYTFAGILILFSITSLKAQDKANVNFGKITPQDFILPAGTDTTAGAVIIADIGQGYFQGTPQGDFSFIFTRFIRIKIVDKKGLEAANGALDFYTNGSGKQKLNDFKGFTYNLENGSIQQVKLNDEDVFVDKINKNLVEKKFTMPAVKEGSVIEYIYTTSSDFLFELQPWSFQGEYPCLWSEYKLGLPEFFNYVFLINGYLKFDINEQKSSRKNYMLQMSNHANRPEIFKISAMESETRWVIKNVPKINVEKFTSTIKNYISSVSFQLSEYREPYEPKKILGDWTNASVELMKFKYFGRELSEENNWLADEMKIICAGALNAKQNAEKIFAYVRDNFTCTGYSAMEMEHSLKETFNKRSGNVAEINLLLIAMLRYNGINAKPVLLSTRNHGFTHDSYPILNLFNYVVCQASIDKNICYLDASHPSLAFNKLPANCYNGHARVIDTESPAAVYFYPDSLIEQKTTTVFVAADERQPGMLAGEFSSQLGYYESLSIRDELKENGKDILLKRIKNSYGMDVDIRNINIDPIKIKDQPLSITYGFVFDSKAEGTMYVNPMLTLAITENYFKSAERAYPVEMPYASDEIYVFNLEIPKGYRVEEIPKSAKVKLNEIDGFFEYLVDVDEDVVRLRSRIKINKATFPPEDYQSLRDFFGFVVKKHAEQIVLKRK
jgi:hypothetical protein